MTSFVRHRIATVIGLLALNGMAFAQEPVEEVLFDEAPPAIADNLPPDPATAAAELSESDSVGILQPLPPEEVPVRQPTIREECARSIAAALIGGSAGAGAEAGHV